MKRSELFPDILERRHKRDRLFYSLTVGALWIGVVALFVLIAGVLWEGLPWLDWQFLQEFPSRKPEKAGFKAAFWGSIWVIALTTLFTVPVGVAGAIYLEEYSANNRFHKVIELLIATALLSIVVLGLGDVTLSAMANILSCFDLGSLPWHGVRHLHLLAEIA